jgi:hypothetical protein
MRDEMGTGTGTVVKLLLQEKLFQLKIKLIIFSKAEGSVADPAFQVNPDPVADPDPGFWWPKNWRKKKIQRKNNLFWIKKLNLLTLGLLKGHPRRRRSR